MKKHSQPCSPRIVFEQPYGLHSPAVAKLLSEAPSVGDEQHEDTLSERPDDRSE